ncbi:IclR family transcriptional regulator [Pandoraea anhela]|uniref:IclR family transcriptional regulator n=1 Tax=Pandoraea anhela TaxID=2508295 RepID=A0A5E4WHY5_9BURK|nr:IclR family transcriptional regulator [Pandoraea anhela]VVE23449.1 IclR family transcriptional regulator [Pandoraea anhela]
MDRALVVLDLIASEASPVSLDELASRVGLHRSIVYRLVRSLENAGFVSRDPVQGGYTYGPALFSIGVKITSRFDIRGLFRPVMEEIVQRFGETASLHVRSGDQRVCVDVVEGVHAIRRVVPVGETLPIYAGETGRALLSMLPDAEVCAYIDAAAKAGTDAKALQRDIATIRKHGHIVGIGMRTPDVGTLSIPLRGPGALAAALTISGPASRWNVAVMEAAITEVLRIIEPAQRSLRG